MRVLHASPLSTRECQESIPIATDQASTFCFCSVRFYCSQVKVFSTTEWKYDGYTALGQRHSAQERKAVSRLCKKEAPWQRKTGSASPSGLHRTCMRKGHIIQHGRGGCCLYDVCPLVQCFRVFSLSLLAHIQDCFTFLNKFPYFSF